MTDVTKVEFDFKWVYDLKPIVAEINPEHLVAVVTGAKKTKYLTMPETDKVFPVEFFPEDSPIEVWPTDKVLDPNYDHAEDGGEFDLSETEVGGIYPVSLLFTAVNYQCEAGKQCRGIGDTVQRRDGIQTLKPGILEQKIELTKDTFMAAARAAGIEVERAQIYPRFRTY